MRKTLLITGLLLLATASSASRADELSDARAICDAHKLVGLQAIRMNGGVFEKGWEHCLALTDAAAKEAAQAAKQKEQDELARTKALADQIKAK